MDSDWDWQLGVNLHGVVNGIQAFLPRMLSSGRGGHIVNTASIAGMFAGAGAPGLLAYSTSKFAVVGLSESLADDLASDGIGVSVLCPGGVATRIIDAGRNRPDSLGGPAAQPTLQARQGGGMQTAMDPAKVAALVVRAVKENQLHIFTHPETRGLVEARCEQLGKAFNWLGGHG
jgi:NAD(P)-dependent dehydrogenase (short-subunit alcohol dehydrogenase family)